MKKLFPFVCILSIVAMVLILAMAPTHSFNYEQPPKDLVDLNKAPKEELESLRWIGPVTAKKIIENRPYKSVNELSKAGVSAVIISKYIEPHVTVGLAGPPSEPVKPVKVAEAK